MYSRAHLLIEKEFELMQQQNLWGIQATPLKDDNLFNWTIRILGLKGTAWEGGVFRLYLKFDEHYNKRPPQVCFHTIPFHPNVDMITGKPCIDFLDDWSQWNESYSFSFLLLTIQSMLSDPVLDNAVNIEAVGMIVNSPLAYKQMVQDCVAASQRVEAGVAPHIEEERIQMPTAQPKDVQITTIKPPSTPGKKNSRISFEDYHTTWSGIATSKSNPDSKNPLLEAMKEDAVMQSAHYGLPLRELHAQMEKQLQEHSQLLYGKFRSKSQKLTEDELKEAKLEKINQMKKIYLQTKGTPRKTPISLATTRENTFMEADPWENEVDDLVSWTNKLDADTI